ncbi:MAG: translation initiation factor IF-3 [Patescibacteria group bacterium]
MLEYCSLATRYFPNKQRTFWRINQNIQARELRVLDSEGKQLGLFSKEEATRLAQGLGLDLVEIAPKARPPVAKIIAFAKFKYQQEKKEREARRKEKKGSEQKEVWLTPFMGDNDYLTKLEKIKEFLSDGSKVRVVVKFKGPQMSHREFGYQLADRVSADTKDLSGIDQTPKFLGRQLIFMLRPTKGQKNEKNQV